MSRKISIYKLKDPLTKEVRYIGKTIMTPRSRFLNHLGQSRTKIKKDYCHCWIKSLLDKGLEPEMEVIEETYDISREKYWISQYRLTSKLTNLAEGGSCSATGSKRTPEQIKNQIEWNLKNTKIEIVEYDESYNELGRYRGWGTLSRLMNVSIPRARTTVVRLHKLKGRLFLLEKDLEEYKSKHLPRVVLENVNTGEKVIYKDYKSFIKKYKSARILQKFGNKNILYKDIYKIIYNKKC